MYGQGLLKGLGITLKHFFGRAITQQYPEERPVLAPRFHGFFNLEVEKCNACATCASWCPNGVIEVESAKDENKKRYVTGFKMDLSYCLFCGLCVEGCPRGGLSFTKDFELAGYFREDMVYDLVELTGGARHDGIQAESA